MEPPITRRLGIFNGKLPSQAAVTGPRPSEAGHGRVAADTSGETYYANIRPLTTDMGEELKKMREQLEEAEDEQLGRAGCIYIDLFRDQGNASGVEEMV
ncbi:hypothetical protein MCOR25_010304 [Pyricularia grisea]|nr:hypothetical protein MCOR25_010304 [Pyricularia grisea]